MDRKRYPTDLTDAQWARLEPLLTSVRRHRGRPRQHPLREIVNAMLYVLRGGISWRALPHDFPPWESVYDHFRRWRRSNALERIHDVLREETRAEQGRASSPTAAVLDTQSVKTAGKKGDAYGYDAGKKVAGRKRHILVDTDGLLLCAVVHAADVQDRDGARLVLSRLHDRASKLKKIWVDGAYAGKLLGWAKAFGGWTLEVVRKKKGQKGFRVLPRRWVVERTLAWISKCRRLSKDYEALSASSEAWIHLAMIGLMLRRLAR